MLRVTFIHNRKKKLNPEGKAVIQMRLYLHRKERYYSTGIYIKPKEWDMKRQKVKSQYLANEYNLQLTELEKRALMAYFDLSRDGRATLLRIIEKLKGNTKSDSFIKFVQEGIENNKNLESSTLSQHRIFIAYLEKYSPTLQYSDITYTFLVNFENFLLNHPSERGGTLSRNYASSLLRIFRTYANEAIRMDLLLIDPFRGFKIRKEATKRVYLELYEVELIESVKIDWVGKSKVARDMFTFSCYTGLRISNAQGLKVKHIIKLDDGLRLVKKPKKTRKKGDPVNLPLRLLFNGKPEKIAMEYIDGKGLEETVFPYISTKQYKNWLDKFALICEINKNITSHVARHAFAMEMQKKLPIEAVRKLMGHSSITTTEVYSRLETSTIDELLKNGTK